MAEIGKINTLTVVKITEFGAFVDGEKHGEILLPNRYMPEGLAEGQAIDVFIYFDSEDRLIATTETPKAMVDQFVSLKVVQVNKAGAFLDWGLPKDLLVPYNQQQTKLVVGKYYLVRVYQDMHTDRIVATTKLDRFLDIWPANYEIGEKVDLIIANKTDLGFKAIINNKHWGLLYDNEIFQPLRTGRQITGYIKQVRDDGRVDLILTRPGLGKIKDFAPSLLAYMAMHNNQCEINDKSSPELIQQTFGVSKKTFKSTVGNLLKQGKIKIAQNSLFLIEGSAKTDFEKPATKGAKTADKKSANANSQARAGKRTGQRNK
ncbi:S1 RNA-binding domain-containing protein [Thalassotalea aquiviva]|uniref:CvfB family protein n=1 Tax=Thalassotalea aquiviva TaxID=3242415 RepID=UPI00352A4294